MGEPRKEVLAEGVEIWLGDCRDTLPLIGKVDAIVTDIPYGLGEHSAKKRASRGKLARPTEYVTADEWDGDPPSLSDIEYLKRVSDWQIIFGGNYADGLGATSCWLVWDKLNGDNDFADCELAWTNLPKAVRRIRWLWNGMIRAEKGIREHPTQKPLGVMKWAIEHLPSSVETVLDPYMGSGTTGCAAISLNKRFIGIERAPLFYDIARRRISAALAQPRLAFDEPAKPKQETLAL